MANIVRQSKFRHVYCKPVKHENCMSDIRITEITWDSLFCAVNPKFIAIINKGAGGPFQVIPVNKIGRIDKDYPFVDAHKAPCLEVVWSPFNDNVIASCSEDTTAKVWLIPDRGLNRVLSDPVVELTGHQKRVNTLAWHPTAQNILLTAGGENKLLMWNVGNGEALLEIAGHPDQIFSIGFNYDGSQFITTCKDKKIRIIDSHSGEVLREGMGHEGVKPQRAIFLKDGRVFTTGFSKRSERLYALRDPNDLSNAIVNEELDTSNGVLFPLYDEDSGLLFLAGKGDCAIRYYEINHEAPFVHYINTYTTSEPQRAIGWMPKRGINSNENEIARIYKVTTKGVVDILQFFVPRKSDLFQTDLYPDTRSTVPAITAEEFADGKNAPPKLCAVNPGAAEVKPKVNVAKKANILASMPAQQAPTVNHYESSTPSSPSPTKTVSSTPQRSPRVDEDMGIVKMSATPQRSPRVDDDMGIVKMERPASSSSSSRQSHASSRRDSPPEQPATNPMIPKQQVSLKSRAERDNGGAPQTSGQKRAAAELERIKRDQARSNTDDVPPEMVRERPRGSASSASDSRGSVIGVGPNEPTNMEELLADLQKMKLVLRQHERRIRLLEDQLADATMSATYGL
uniref:Coronin n=1 Tax=Panagrolaimus sp. JU765 TaxID=591449 RepID=A0AC34RIR5_9BILA